MNDTTILPNVPAYVQIDRGHGHGHGGYNRGVSEKDRLHLDSDFLGAAIRDLDVAIERTGRSAELATEKIGAAGVLASEKHAAAIQLSTRLDFSNTQNLLISGFKDGRYDAAVNTAAIQTSAAENACKIQTQLAECCCEIKELVRAEAGVTRELVRSIDADRLADKLSDAKAEIQFLKLSAGNGNGNGNN